MRLELTEWGDPSLPTLVLVHGVTSHGRRYERLAAERLASRFHVLAPDLRGHGHSGAEPPWTLEQHVADLLETVPADARLWVGHSFGGRILLELAAAHPERVERALLLDPVIWVPPPIALGEAEASLERPSYASVAEAVDLRLAANVDHGVAREDLERDFAVHLAEGPDGRLRFRFSTVAAIAAYGEMARTPPESPLERPIRIARCRESGVCPPELIDAHREAAGVLLTDIELPGGHTPMWDAFDETAAAIVDFLDVSRSVSAE